MFKTMTVDDLRQHELVILRRLRGGPLTEFELAAEIAEHSGYTTEQAANHMGDWLEDLTAQGYVWAGKLRNRAGNWIRAAALTNSGRRLVG